MVVANPARSLYSERRRRALRALCVSAFSSLGICPFNFKLSPVNRTSLRPFLNSHRIISFAYPRLLTPIESYSCKKQGEGVPSTLGRRRGASYSWATRRNSRNSNIFMGLLYNSRTARGWGLQRSLCLRHSTFDLLRSLPTTHYSIPATPNLLRPQILLEKLSRRLVVRYKRFPQQEVMNFVRNVDHFNRHIAFPQPLHQVHRLALRNVSIVVALNQQHRRFPFVHGRIRRRLPRKLPRFLQIRRGRGILFPGRQEKRPIMNTVIVDTRSENVGVPRQPHRRQKSAIRSA